MKQSHTGDAPRETTAESNEISGQDLNSTARRPGRPRKYSNAAEARAVRVIAKREARDNAIVSGQIRVTVQVPASQRDAIVAYAKMLRESARAARARAGLAPRPSDRTRPRQFGPTEQETALRAWREGGTLDDLRVAGIDIEQACAWLCAVGEAGSVAEAYRQLQHETTLVRQLQARDTIIAASRAALPALLAGQAAHRPKATSSAEDQLRKFDSADDAGDDDDESWP